MFILWVGAFPSTPLQTGPPGFYSNPVGPLDSGTPGEVSPCPGCWLDEMNRRLSLPAVSGREERLDVPWSRVKSFIVVETRAKKDRDGDSMTLWYPTVVLSGPQAEERNEAFVEWTDENKATALVKWLGEKVR